MLPSRPLKFTIIGDGMVGKTSLLLTFTQYEFPEEYVPTVFDNHVCQIYVDGKNYDLSLWDTPGQEEYHQMKPIIYPNTDCFIICYSVKNKASFENVKSTWYPEVKSFSPNVPVVLVGTQTDLNVNRLERYVSTKEARELRAKIRAFSVVECSAKKNHNVANVFEEAVRAVKATEVRETSTCKCTLV